MRGSIGTLILFNLQQLGDALAFPPLTHTGSEDWARDTTGV